MAQPEIHVGDIGTTFEVTLKQSAAVVDLSSATVKQIYFMKPDGSTLTKTASFTTDGTDGKIYYNTTTGDLDTAGDWQLQAVVTFGASVWHSSIAAFAVFPNLV